MSHRPIVDTTVVKTAASVVTMLNDDTFPGLVENEILARRKIVSQRRFNLPQIQDYDMNVLC